MVKNCEDPILKFHENTIEEVRKEYGLDKPGAMDAAVDILDDWVKQQSHFVKKDFKREYLERTIITTKGSLERAKKRIDKVCTMRTLFPQYFGDYDVKEYFKEYYDKKHLTHAILPYPTADNYRVYLIKHSGSVIDSKAFTDLYRLFIIFAEYLVRHDYVKGFLFVVDYTDASIVDLAAKINLVELRQVLALLMEGYGVRLKGIHILTPSKVVDVIVAVFKQVLSAKIGSRIQVHKTLESLHEYIPRKILPKDYGGDDKSLIELHDAWTELLNQEENRQYQREINAACTDESLRQRDTFNEQYMGMPGSFRVLSVD